ncbi:hypothetical protein RN001_007108 [Aquatica leii]|uniref:Chitin-binding type-2 domain-containing protein n=1 Tax=Aquatica leii TaxID=1421715 RepID=A0AAN7PXT4_9COLE|nr:hypothetical protein RN001_007108 [Aquatica leii]
MSTEPKPVLASTTTLATTTTLVTTTTPPPPVCPVPDPIFFTVLFPHPICCNLYYACSNGIAYLMRCAMYLYFNPLYNSCDFSFNVNCQPPKMYCP